MLRLTGIGAASNTAQIAIFLAAFLMLTGLIYIKNKMLATQEPSHYLGTKGGSMDKVVDNKKLAIASVAETFGGLGISNLTTVGPLV